MFADRQVMARELDPNTHWKEYDLPWGVKFPYGLPGPTTAGFMRSEYGASVPVDVPSNELVAVHPTQLYETLAALVICAIGVALIRRGRSRPGEVVMTTLALLAVERFFVEFLRAKDDRFLGSFTLAQGLSVLLVICIVLVWSARSRGARAEGG